jgi:hypothetical protein
MKSFDNLAVEQKAFEGATFAPIKRNVDELSRRIEVLARIMQHRLADVV